MGFERPVVVAETAAESPREADAAAEPTWRVAATARPLADRAAVVLKKGTEIHVEISERLTVARSQGLQGNTFVALLTKPLRSGKRTVAEKGSRVEGVYEPAEGKDGQLVLALKVVRIETVTGRVVAVDTRTVDRRAWRPKGTPWRATLGVSTAVLSVVFPPVAFATQMATPALIPPQGAAPAAMPVVVEGTKIEFKLKRDLTQSEVGGVRV